MAKLHVWEDIPKVSVDSSLVCTTARMEVPGGWVYAAQGLRESVEEVDPMEWGRAPIAMVFVPKSEPAKRKVKIRKRTKRPEVE